jgi:hypothetical protein
VPRAVPSKRREHRAERVLASERQLQTGERQLGTVGDRPPSPFGGLPIAEIAIFAGIVAVIVGVIQGGPALLVGIIVCVLGVLEVTVREHFSGFRSHSTLLAAFPAVGLEIALVATVGEPRNRALLLLAVVPVYAVSFWFLRKRFRVARQVRLARPTAR